MKLCPICQRCYEDTDAICSEDQTTLVQSRPGSRIIAEKYRLDRLLGRGGVGAVYAGTHVDLDRPIAIKLLLPDFTSDADALERFRREARAAARLNHPNIADTYDYGALPEGGSYIIMELIDGQTLREYMNATGALSIPEALLITQQVCDGIDTAHAGGIVHRDLKPSNIVLRSDHLRRLQAKVVDFGVAKLKEHSTGSGGTLTATGSLIGTPRYMSPEQCSGHGADARSDIYSMGVILYEMLTGHPPFDAPTATAIALKHIQQPPPPLTEFRADIPEALERLVMQLLAKEPSERPQTAADLCDRLKTIEQSTPILNSPDSLKTISTFDQQALSDADVLSVASQHDPRTNERDSRAETDNSTVLDRATRRTGEPTLEYPVALPNTQDPLSIEAYAESSSDAVLTDDALSQSKTLSPAVSINAGIETKDEATGNTTEPKAVLQSPVHPNRSVWPYYAAIAATLFALAFLISAFWAMRRTSSTETPPVSQAPSPEARTGASPAVETASPAPALSTASNDPRSELRSLLERWIVATNARDIEEQLSFYAPTLEAFYLQRNASRQSVREEKTRIVSQVTSVEVRAGEPEISLSSDGNRATMRFRKNWSFKGGQQPSSGEVIQELQWLKTVDGWKIVSERDVQVIR